MGGLDRTLRLALPLALASGVAPTGAAAFTFESSVSPGCHERITLAALRAVGWPGGAEPPDLSVDNGLRVAADVPFTVPPEAQNPWALALLVGVRDNDLHGNAPQDLPALSFIHSDPVGQREHCLRAPEHDGADGDAAALAACRGFILEEVRAALGPGADVDLRVVETVRVALAFTSAHRANASRYAFHMGRALHALQDSFTHTFRAPDDARRVRHVLNFADWAIVPDYSAARDGHAHISILDDCDADTDAARRRERDATEASTALLRAVANAAGGRAGRLERAGRVLDVALAHEPGCTAGNRWCGATEPGEEPKGCAVATPGRPTHAGAVALAALALLAAARRRRGAALAAALAAALPGRAAAQTTPPPPPPALRRFGLEAALSGSLDEGALAVSAGGHWNASARFALSLRAEINPWFSLDAGKVVPGAFNVYASGVYSWARFPSLALRTSVRAGASVLLIDLVGAPAGAVGPYLGINLLGVALPLGGGARLVVDPADVAVPIPQLRGVPFYYAQYRFTIGVEWDP